MARTEIVPIGQVSRRAPEAGRIRIGVKTEKAMKSIDTFRFTSQHQNLIEQLADMYGGTPKPWSEPKARIQNQYEVITTTSQIPVYLPPGGLSQNYELWGGGGCLRRCDGIVVEQVVMHGDNAVPEQSPCICVAKGQSECRPYTRITVVLPELPFAGTWRLETKGWNALAELPGMFDMVTTLQGEGQMVQALLGVEKRADTVGGKKRQFVVPTLAIAESPKQIQAGQATVGAIGGGRQAGIGPAPRLELDAGEDIVDGEVISDEEMTLRDLLADDASEHHVDPARFVHAIASIDGGVLEHGARVHDDIAAGRATPTGFNQDGSIRWRKS